VESDREEPSSETRELAPLSARFLGQVIDAAIAYAIMFLGILFSSLIPFAQGPLAGGGIFLGIAYFLLSDGLPGGRSLGKRVVKTEVIDARTGEPCTILQSLGRNILSICGLFDWMFIFGRDRRRLGDKAAGTCVVRAE
jgi:uncharacterized RDD family membrane protein YckC